MLMILCSQAKLENDNKGINVKRGLKAKCDLGIRPGHCPLGYYNEMNSVRGKSRILVDEERSPIIKEIFSKVANEFWTGREIFRWLKEDLDFKTRTGKHVTLGGIYRILESTFYYGEFEFPKKSGNWCQGTHEPLITKELFERTRGNLISAPKQWGLKEFQFTRIIKCSYCGSTISGYEKIKRNLSGGQKRYVYYHCATKKEAECRKTHMREEELISQFILLIDKINFNKTRAIGKLKKEVEKYNKLSQVMFGEKLISKKEININKTDIKSYAKYILKEGGAEEKREMLLNLKGQFIIKDKKVVIK